MRIKGVISDMDGVILDSEKLYVRFWCEAARFYGFPMQRTHALEIRSMARALANKLLVSRFGEEFDCDAVRNKRTELMNAYIDKYGIESKPGAQALLDFLRENSYRVALATATPAERAADYLKRAGLLEYFDVITSAKEVQNGKPAPDIYIYAAHRLGLEPGECMALEDSPNGIRSAHGAGCFTVMVPDLDAPSPEIMPLVDRVSDGLVGVIEIIKQQVTKNGTD